MSLRIDIKESEFIVALPRDESTLLVNLIVGLRLIAEPCAWNPVLHLAG